MVVARRFKKCGESAGIERVIFTDYGYTWRVDLPDKHRRTSDRLIMLYAPGRNKSPADAQAELATRSSAVGG